MYPKGLSKYWRRLTKRAVEPSLNLTISSEVIAFIKRTARGSPLAETGGILIGHHAGHDIRVTKATDAGPSAQASIGAFVRDTQHCQKILADEFALSGADYVGEWHSHVIDLPHPSRGDLETLARIVLDPDYNFPSFAMILANIRKEEVELSTYVVIPNSGRDSLGRKSLTVAKISLDEYGGTRN
jgi:integrative and conjugative element protein (TIGR02256 family)